MELAASQLVKLYMQTQITMGYIYYAPTPEARLLDALNGLSDMGPVKRGRFLELSNVTIQHADGRQEKLPVAYINKATVQLAGTLGDADAGRGIGAQDGPKSYPFVEKSPLAVRIETQSYVVTGNMYRVTYQKVWHVLEDTPTFLPLTHAQICTVANGTRERVPFVAVNKEHILSLQEEDIGLVARQKAVEPKNRGGSKKP
jgi:hypothetical protein